jgi:hypothetical protein
MTDIDVAFFKNPFPDVWRESIGFDIGLCNGSTGAVYFSGSDESKHFMLRWYEMNEHLLDSEDIYREYDRKYKGLDQASFGYLLECGSHRANVVRLPVKYHSTCHDFDVPCYLMHYHSRMRNVVSHGGKLDILDPEIRSYAIAWKRLLEESNENTAS